MKPGPGEESLVAVDVAVDTAAPAAVVFFSASFNGEAAVYCDVVDVVVVVVVVGFAAVVVAAPSLTPPSD